MGDLKKYTISFGSLPNGEHVFKYNLDDEFFANFETSEIHSANIITQVTLDKKPHLLKLTFELAGTIQTECDRCLDIFDLPVMYHALLYVKFRATHEDESDEVVVIPANDSELNIAKYFYEFAVLSLPIRKVHPDRSDNGESTCNPVMIEKLNKILLQENVTFENNIFKDLKNLIN